ncbi:DUF4855 domain-containing protein [Paenibacillus sp. MBLB4367]|uniref:DUF4855 domain-containing protein n=1 Tax=Paenibacillus sp. MBLB4367 TaxID=3384767 RepID=UPI0039083BA7
MMKKWKRQFLPAIAALTILSSFQPALAAKEEPAQMRNLASGLSYRYSDPPSENYPDSGTKLTDGKYADPSAFWDANWMAFLRGKTREITFDLGESKSIGRINAHFLYDHAAGIYTPNIASFYVSEDGTNWAPVKHMNSPMPLWTPSTAAGYDYSWNGETDGVPHGDQHATMAYARYVKIAVTTQIWVFMDEVEIWGADGKAKHAKKLKPEMPAYLQPGESTAGIRDLVLLYNGFYESGAGNWKKEDIIPYISYTDKNGSPKDWFYDGVLYLGLRTSDNARDFGINSLFSDWQWYLDKTFAESGDMRQLNEAVKEAGAKLGDNRHKVKVVLMIPLAADTVADFGDVDGDGVSENFVAAQVGEETAYANRQKAIRWYMNEVKKRWSAGNYDRLELDGMYWLSEGISHGDRSEPKLIQETRDRVHREGQKFFWIPFFAANMNFAASELGFDAAALQPNHFFDGTDPIRIEDTAYLARHHGLGVEMETDERMNTDEAFRARYIDYLNGGVDFGYMTGAFKAYYQGNTALLQSSRSDNARVRELYDWMYQFVKGTYQKQSRS